MFVCRFIGADDTVFAREFAEVHTVVGGTDKVVDTAFVIRGDGAHRHGEKCPNAVFTSNDE